MLLVLSRRCLTAPGCVVLAEGSVRALALCVPGSMFSVSGLLLSRSSVLRPGLLYVRGLSATTLRHDGLREPGAVRPPLWTRSRAVPSAQGPRWASAGPRDPTQDPNAAKQDRDPPSEDGGKPSKRQQLKKVFKEYGAVAGTFHVGISLVSLGIFYALVSSGLDVASLLLKVGFSEAVVQSKIAAGTSTFVLAYAIHKLFAPVRMSITLVSVPFIVRYLRRIGLFKPPTKAL